MESYNNPPKLMQFIAEKLSSISNDKIGSEVSEKIISIINKSISLSQAKSISIADINRILFAVFRQIYSFPINTIELFITENCNCRCDDCFVRFKSDKAMSEEVAIASVNYLIKESGEHQNLTITFFGGEPLLEYKLIKSVIDYVDSIKKTINKNVYYRLTTNGTIASDEIYSIFKGRFNLLLSINGAEYSHDKHRKFIDKKPSFNCIMTNLELLKKYQPWLGTRMTCYPDTIDRLADNVKFLYGKGIRHFQIGLSFGSEWNGEINQIYREQMRNILQFYISLKKQNQPITIPLFDGEKTNCTIFGCSAGRNTLTVSPSGKLYPCSMMVGLKSLITNDYCLGNVFEGITELHLRDDFISLHCPESGACASCDITGYCHGGCPAQNYYETGFINKPAKYTCEIARINKSLADEYAAIMQESAAEAKPKAELVKTEK
jgi:uncharacterized protein